MTDEIRVDDNPAHGLAITIIGLTLAIFGLAVAVERAKKQRTQLRIERNKRLEAEEAAQSRSGSIDGVLEKLHEANQRNDDLERERRAALERALRAEQQLERRDQPAEPADAGDGLGPG